jgi:hypothetical protein
MRGPSLASSLNKGISMDDSREQGRKLAARTRAFVYSIVLVALVSLLVFLLINTPWNVGGAYLIGALIWPGADALVIALIFPDFLRALKGKR